MCMAVGNVSFDDCDMLTWSLGWTGFLEPMTPPLELDGPVGDDLVGVHVGLRAAARLPDAQRELVVERALGHLARRLLDEAGQRLVQLAEIAVDPRPTPP